MQTSACRSGTIRHLSPAAASSTRPPHGDISPESDEYCTDAEAEAAFAPFIASMNRYYQKRGIFQGRFGFGKKPAVIVIDFAFNWTDERYPSGSARMDEPV
eukprot:SAG11_NODE_10663_length_813_cov_1.770308_1_plen_100_part_10